jgi:uncharacterized repeat protein (TIGR01451 family)
MTHNWTRYLALWCASWLLAAAAQAQNMLFVSTSESSAGGLTIINNARAAFQAEAAARGMLFVDRTGGLADAGTSLNADIASASMLVLVTVFNPAQAARMSEVNTAMLSRPDLLVLGFIDGCCSQAENINTFVPYADSIAPWGAMSQAYRGARVTSPVNLASPYGATFPASIEGDYYTTFGNVPAAYQLYTDPFNPGNAFGFFVPQAASNSGAGACLFMTGDSSVFQFGVQPDQSNAIANAFATAALDPAGACKQAAAGVPDLAVGVTGPGSLTPYTPASYTLTVSNPGALASTATTVSVTLPAGVTVLPASLPAGCTAAAGNGGFSCNVSALAVSNPAASVSFPFQVLAAAGAAGGDIVATVATQANEVNTANNTTRLPVAVGVAPPPAPVPSLDLWALLALSGLLPLLARRRKA